MRSKRAWTEIRLYARYTADAAQQARHPIDVSKLMLSGDPSSNVTRIVVFTAEAAEAMKNKNLLTAVAKLEEANKLDPGNDLIIGNLGSAYGNCASVAFMLHNFPQAEKYFNQAIPLLKKSSNKANYISVLKNYGNMLRLTGRNAEAEKVSSQVKALESTQ